MSETDMYCMKDKRVTETLDPREEYSANGRLMMKGICAICGSRKAKFLKMKGRRPVPII